MPIADFAITTFATFFVAIGPVDTALVFGGLTGGVHRPDWVRLALRAVFIAGGVLFAFALFEVQLLGALHVPLDAFRFAGGVLLLLQAIQLIFGHPAGPSTLTAGERREALEPGDIAIFPLAFPVIVRSGRPHCRGLAQGLRRQAISSGLPSSSRQCSSASS